MSNIPLFAIVFGLVAVAAAGTAQAVQIAGAIDADGQPQVTSTKYHVSHPGTGHYIITFTHAFPAPYATCLFTTVGRYSASGLTETTKSCDVTFINSSGSLTNVLFNFLAVNTTN